MSGMLRTPQLNATEPEELARELKSYILQLIPELNWVLESIQTKEVSQVQVNGVQGGKAPNTPEAIESFNQIKSLIIKSADIVNSFSESVAAKLEGEYVASSDFGVYQQNTQSLLEATSQSVTQNYENIQSIKVHSAATDAAVAENAAAIDAAAGQISSSNERIAQLEVINMETSSYIKSGLLYYGDDGMPVYGLEIGQTNEKDGEAVFNKFARFSSDRLSFFDNNGVEVAYISDSKLYISAANITGVLQLGGYQVDTASGIAFKWVGR